jgi:ribosomal protein S6--L-glutamate ligase
MFAIGGRVFGVKREVRLFVKDGGPGEPFTPTPELSRVVLRCGEAFGIHLYGVDVIERDGTPYVVDMNSIPGFKGVPDAPLRVARYLYSAAERTTRGERLFDSALAGELASTAGLR